MTNEASGVVPKETHEVVLADGRLMVIQIFGAPVTPAEKSAEDVPSKDPPDGEVPSDG